MAGATELRAYAMLVYFLLNTLATYLTLIAGYPLWFVSRAVARGWMNLGERYFAVSLVAITQALAGSEVEFFVTNPETARGLSVDSAGRLHAKWAPRAVVIANHQLYSDWIYLWWVAYTANLHGSLTIALKRSLKSLPVLGWGMQNLQFLFLSRKWEQDEAVIKKSMTNLAADVTWPSWLLIFPEGTTTSANGVNRSRAYAEKSGLPLPRNLMLPRVRGLQAALRGLDNTVPVLYDFTIYYSGVPEGSYGENVYSLKNMYLHGKVPAQIRIHLREFTVSEIPYANDEKFAEWLNARWQEKDEIFDALRTGATEAFGQPVKCQPKLNSLSELYGPFNLPLSALLLGRLWAKRGEWLGGLRAVAPAEL